MSGQVDQRESVIEVNAVSKQIRRHLILDNITLQVLAKQTIGISGPNGSGKSMLLRVISGLVRPTRGTVRVFGKLIGKESEFPPLTGALIETPGFLPQYSGFKNLHLLAMLRNEITSADIQATLRRVGLDPTDPRAVKTYSTGMRQRLGLAQAVMEKPRLLLLDEPTNGLDREGMREIYRLLQELKTEGVTILLTSHSREEMQILCDAVFHLEHGLLSPDN